MKDTIENWDKLVAQVKGVHTSTVKAVSSL
jgi:hypothetical protein